MFKFSLRLESAPPFICELLWRCYTNTSLGLFIASGCSADGLRGWLISFRYTYPIRLVFTEYKMNATSEHISKKRITNRKHCHTSLLLSSWTETMATIFNPLISNDMFQNPATRTHNPRDTMVNVGLLPWLQSSKTTFLCFIFQAIGLITQRDKLFFRNCLFERPLPPTVCHHC